MQWQVQILETICFLIFASSPFQAILSRHEQLSDPPRQIPKN